MKRCFVVWQTTGNRAGKVCRGWIYLGKEVTAELGSGAGHGLEKPILALGKMRSWGIKTFPCNHKRKRSEVQRAAVCLLYLCTLPWLCAFSKGYLYFEQREIAAGPVKDVRGALTILAVPPWACSFQQCLPSLLQLDTSGGSRVCKHRSGQLCLVLGMLWGAALVKNPWMKERAWRWSCEWAVVSCVSRIPPVVPVSWSSFPCGG